MKIILFAISFLGVVITSKSQDTLTIQVGARCEMCEERIESTTAQIIGVLQNDFSLKNNQLEVIYSPELFVEAELHRALIAVGHDTNLMKADDDTYNDLPSCCYYRSDEKTKINPNVQDSYCIGVSGACGMCKMRIETAALNTIGVDQAKYDLEKQQLNVNISIGFILEELYNNIASIGHDTDNVKASNQTYQDLPMCCLYRPESHEKNQVVGYVYTNNLDGKREPLIGANVYWANLSQSTMTDQNGSFKLILDKPQEELVITYIGFRNDTIVIDRTGHVEIDLNPAAYLDEIEIKERKRTTEVSYMSPVKVLNIGKRELTKAACCSLAESFQTTPAVDESFTDAVTGTKTIEMLGLASPYIQITREAIPDIRGLSAVFGMEYTPGPWINGIQVNQGAGSVTNGFEGITGQINVDLYHPYSDEKLYFNAYANEGGRYEANLTFNQEVSDHLATAFLLHGSTRTQVYDRNEDGFLDMPLTNQIVAINRWKYFLDNGWEGQFGVKLTFNEMEAGQVSFYDDESPNSWASHINTDRYEFWAKSGRLFNENRSTVGFQISGVYHDMVSKFGNRNYLGTQKTLFANIIYQTLIGESGTNIKGGLSYLQDIMEEKFAESPYQRREYIPGIYTEYTYLVEEKFSLVAGLRYDRHNNFGGFITPRLHVRYAPNEKTVFRVAGGRGQKTASIFAEEIGALASSRDIIIEGSDGNQDLPYGLQPEIAWNVGVSLQKEMEISGQRASFGIDFYRTEFQNQVVVDYDNDYRTLKFYNLEGASFSNSLQFMLEYELVDKLDLRLAYRLNDVQVDFQQGRLEKPLIAKHRYFANLAYESNNGWKFDFTINRIGSKRIPLTRIETEERSPGFFLSNAQISKLWNNRYEVYLGGDNIFNYRQDNPIRGSDNPFGDDFDASLIWGPIFGRIVYVGIRYKLFNEE